MPMSKPNETASIYTMAILPKEFISGRKFIKLQNGMEKTITDAVFSVYNAKDRDGNLIVRKDGTNVTNTTVYVGFDDGTYTSVKSNVAVSQIAQICPDFIYSEEVGITSYKTETCKVRVVTVDTKYGDKTFPTWAFDPVE